MFVRELNPYQMKIIQEFFSTKGQTIMSWMRECVLWSDADPLCHGPPKIHPCLDQLLLQTKFQSCGQVEVDKLGLTLTGTKLPADRLQAGRLTH